MSPALASLVLALAAGAAQAEPLRLPAEIGRATVAVQSFKSLRDHGIVKQQHDYSCGAASLATLLTYGLDDPVGEAEILERVIARLVGEQEAELKAKGVSLLDLKAVTEDRGHRASGFRLELAQLGRIARPVMVFIRPFGYEHFAVLRGIRNGTVHLADPSLGHWRMPLSKFAAMWADDSGRGVIFIVERRDGRWLDTGPLALGVQPLAPTELLAIRSQIDPARRIATEFSPRP
jgi:uncharacterized protein